MNKYIYDIQPDEQIPCWWVSDITKTPEQSVRATFDAEINSGEGYVQIIYPVRKQFIQRCELQDSEYIQESCPNLYLSFEHDRIDFTDFLHTPHRLSVYARTWISVDKPCTIPFKVVTCGGIKIWVRGEEILCFTPYTRNIPSYTTIEIPCIAGMNEVLVHADELAERDVFFYFSLVYTGTQSLSGALEVPFDPKQLVSCKQYLESLSFLKDIFINEDLQFAATAPIPPGIHMLSVHSPNLTVTIPETNARTSMQCGCNSGTHEVNLIAEQKFDQGASVYRIPCERLESPVFADYLFTLNIPVDSRNTGSTYASCEAKKIAITRKLTCAVDWQPDFLTSPAFTISERKKQVLDYLSNHSQKTCTQAVALFATTGICSEEARQAFLASLEVIQNKQDCSDFHLPVVLVCLKRYPGLCAEFESATKEAILDYRYWIDEPGDDVMWFFSENHALLFHTCQYLAGLLYPNDIFLRSGRTGQEQQAIAKARLETWFTQFLTFGYAEWNSITYIPIDLIGFFALELLAEDHSLRSLATRSLDKTFEILGAHDYKGVLSCSYGRTYEANLKARHLSETSMMAFVTNGCGWMTRTNLATSLYCISTYQPPQKAEVHILNSSHEQIVSFVQGAQRAELYTARTASHSIGSVRAYRPFVHGHQQHTLNIVLQNPIHQMFLNHPGERCYSGGNRPSYWAGNGTLPLIHQYRSSALVRYRIDVAEPVHYIHLYAPLYAMDQVESSSRSWFFCRMGESYLGVWFSAGYEITSFGANRNKELISRGDVHDVVVSCGDQDEFGDFSRFIKLHTTAKHIRHNGAWGFVDPRYGLLAIDANGEFSIKGESCTHADNGCIAPVTLDKSLANPLIEQIDLTLELVIDSFKEILYNHDDAFMENLGKISPDTEHNKRYTHWEWPQGVGLFGLWRIYEFTHRDDLLEVMVEYYDTRLAEGLPGKNINTISPLLCLSYLYEETGKESYKAVCIEWADWILHDLERTHSGGFQHITSDSINEEELWDDTLFMAVLFLARMGVLCKSEEYLEEAKFQFLVHARYLADPKSGLWYHGWTFNGNHHFANAFWGRGNCWITLAIPLLLEMIPSIESSFTRQLSEIFQRQVTALVELQSDSGLWHTLLDDPESYGESSATAGFGAGIWMGMRSGILESNLQHSQCVLHGLEAVLANINHIGVLHQCSYGTPMGRLSKEFYKQIPLRPMPYGQALAMLLLVEAKMWMQEGFS